MAEAALGMRVLSGVRPAEWDELIAFLPGAHFLQTHEWAEVKAPIGWEPLPVLWQAGGGPVQAAALILVRSLRLGRLTIPLRVMYAPKGPLLDWSDTALRRQVLSDLQEVARQKGAIFLKIDPDVLLGRGFPGTEEDRPDEQGALVGKELLQTGWRFSPDQIQFRNTVILNLDAEEEELLARMKQKTRYNIRLAEKKGVVVCPAGESDLHELYQMYAETSVRDGFVIRGEDYYRRVWTLFMQRGMAEPLIARVDGQPVAGLVAIRFAGRAWYVYGMSRQAHREKMPNYLLQWEAIRRARAAGCREYDLWGAPQTNQESDPLWGVYRFKEGLGGEVQRTLGAWDLPVKPFWYKLYTQSLPRLLEIMRRRGRTRTRQEVNVL